MSMTTDTPVSAEERFSGLGLAFIAGSICGVLVVLLAACGGDGTSASTRTPTTGASDTTAVTTTMESTVPATEPSTTQATMPTTTVAELLDHLQLDFEGCTQFSTNTGVSLEAAAPYVPDTATVFVSDLGEARVALIT